MNEGLTHYSEMCVYASNNLKDLWQIEIHSHLSGLFMITIVTKKGEESREFIEIPVWEKDLLIYEVAHRSPVKDESKLHHEYHLYACKKEGNAYGRIEYYFFNDHPELDQLIGDKPNFNETDLCL